MKKTKKILHFFLLIYIHALSSASLNLVVYSKNRAHQVHRFLESFILNTTGCRKISVIYKADTKEHEKGYAIVRHDFPQVNFIKQSKSSDFKKLTINAIDFDGEDYIVFAVDDIIVTRKIDFDEIVKLLETFQSTGFYLRLGEHINECYSENRVTGTPPLKEITSGILCWKFKDGKGDWNYPHSLDMTVYKKSDLFKVFYMLPFTNPNMLEGNWAAIAPKYETGLCYKNAPIVNCPLNRVQNTWNNRHSNECTPEELLEVFLTGYKMDIMPLQNIFNKAPHMDYKPTFIKRY
ncbi:MAG: hypothetical protein K2X90_04050 [Candidatus Babeliaceae bacterium]|nr:hypothetical protein [Candidatus Babeliaceae bacterium]